jgi:hypothetical protein
MSYLIINPETDMDMSKAVISVWFRIPKESADAVRAEVPPYYPWTVMWGVIPIITWGPQPMAGTGTDTPVYQKALQFPSNPIVVHKITFEGPPRPVSPSFIGVFVGGKDNNPDAQLLMVNIQTATFATGKGLYTPVTGWSGTDTGFVLQVPIDSPYLGDPIYINVEYTTTDMSNEYLALKPDSFGTTTSNHVTVAFDKWHHLLISWDLNDRKMWCALDDVNLTGRDLPAWNDPSAGDNPNQNWSSNEFGNQPTESRPDVEVTLTKINVPVTPINIPAAEVKSNEGDTFVITTKNLVKHVELAELLMFTDITLDTSIENNRRLFITKPNKKGEQFPTNPSPIYIPMRKFAFGDPANWEPGADNPAFVPPLFDPSATPTSIKALSRAESRGGTADIDFTKCCINWQMGRNLGIAKCKVEKVGKIKAYLSDPKIKTDTGG